MMIGCMISSGCFLRRLHARNPERDGRHPKVPMLGGIFAATAPARWCHPAWLPEFRTDQLIGGAGLWRPDRSAGTRTAATTGDPVGVHDVRIARIDGQRL